MERAAYAHMAENEDRHCWFVGRRAVIGAMLDRIGLPDRPRILEADRSFPFGLSYGLILARPHETTEPGARHG